MLEKLSPADSRVCVGGSHHTRRISSENLRMTEMRSYSRTFRGPDVSVTEADRQIFVHAGVSN